ncbi:MAG TPA: BtpA/SgcQ family protein, partial [Longimicrobiales bacterium]
VVGMVHLLPLPGSPRYGGSMSQILDRARRDAEALVAGGVDGIIVENYGDTPFYPDGLPATAISALTLAAAGVRAISDLPLGVNALRNDAAAALSIAAVTGADFIRVNVHVGAMLTDQGWISGRAHETVRMRAALNARVAIFADVMVKHSVPPHGLTIESAAADAYERANADALLVSGAATGAPADPEDARRVKRVVPAAPLWVGSGVNAENVVALLDTVDGVIVGSAFEKSGKAGAEVMVDQVRRLVDVVRSRHS